MGFVCIVKLTGRVREWSRYGTPSTYDPILHNLLEQAEPPLEGTYWTGTGWAPLPPKTAQELDTDLQTFLDSEGGKIVKSIVTVLVQKGVLTVAEIKTAYRNLA